ISGYVFDLILKGKLPICEVQVQTITLTFYLMMTMSLPVHSGQRAQLLLPPLKENDTHCLNFLFYQGGGRENNSPLGVPVFNSSGPAYHAWKGVELAVSTFWPNFYQVHR
uniref:Uncharacterized protein n=1 Tax=Cynoglossus semilaevis TaxID=244447 RepID=A0A3P8VFI8_CYNSE